MVNAPTNDHREVIARRSFVDETVGELIARHGDEVPTIDVHLAPEGSGQRVDVGLTPSDAREVADQLRHIADVAQRAGWTPEVLADVRERYLPGASDEQIMARLDRLTEQLGGSVLGLRRGTLDWKAGRVLTAQVGIDVMERARGAVEDAVGQLSVIDGVINRLTELRDAFDDLRRFYQGESEPER